jgi:hypothetical protein
MTRAKVLLISATCAFAVAAGTPALALNPQPLPPGLKSQYKSQQTYQTSARACTGQHIPK